MRKLYIFTNTVGGGHTGFENCYSMADDGTVLGNHLCSSVLYMYGDLVDRSDRRLRLEEHFGGKEGEVFEVISLPAGVVPPDEVLEKNKNSRPLPESELAGVKITCTDDEGGEKEFKIP